MSFRIATDASAQARGPCDQVQNRAAGEVDLAAGEVDACGREAEPHRILQGLRDEADVEPGSLARGAHSLLQTMLTRQVAAVRQLEVDRRYEGEWRPRAR